MPNYFDVFTQITTNAERQLRKYFYWEITMKMKNSLDCSDIVKFNTYCIQVKT